MPSRIAVLVSGQGSNLRALHAYFDAGPGAPDAAIALVASDNATCGAMAFARDAAIPVGVIARPEAAGMPLLALLQQYAIDLVVLAGYLRLVPAEAVRAYRGRMVNVHPALLPAFGGPGLHGERVHRAVLASGARVSGATVHFVDEEFDHGPCLAQWPVPVFPHDGTASLARRVLRVEHLLLPRAVHALARGAVRLDESGRVAAAWASLEPDLAFLLQDATDDAIALSLASALPG